MSKIPIIRVEALPRRTDRVRVHLGDGQTFELARLVADEAGLRPGADIDELALANLRGRGALQEALDRALHFLEPRPRSEREVRTRLAQKGTAPELIDPVIGRLRELGMIDDRAFARYWIENRARFSPRGGRLVKAELRQKGVTSEVVAELDEGVDEAAAIGEVAPRLARRLGRLDRQTFRRKLWAQLARRGFDYDTIGPAIDAAWQALNAEAPENRSDAKE
ncbi:MAG: regulatory protein RecX [Chloroflexota bacterium]